MKRFAMIFAVAAVALSGPAFAAKVENEKGSTKNADIPKCTKKLGTVAIVDGEGQGWLQYELGAPSTLIKTFVQRSGCFGLVNRGAGMAAAQAERALAAGGDLQRGSNVGGGQVKAADYVIQADIATSNSNSGGSGFGAIAGGIIGNRLGVGAIGIKNKKSEAQTVLALMNVRTSEEAAFEGFAKVSDLSFGLGGGWGFGGAVGGGYENTDIGKVVSLSFLDAYRKLVTELGWVPDNAAAAAPKQAYIVRSAVSMKRSPSASGTTVRSLDPGQLLYPTGAKEGMWWEVADENDNTGWVMNDKLEPKK
jgi:curli biogenesis system outer membrane secretion channel CsgG